MTEVMLKLFNMSISAGWLILAVILLRLVLRRTPKAFRYILWALVAVRLVLPISFESETSLIPSSETVPPSILYEQIPEIHSGITTLNGAVNPVLQESFSPAPAAPVTEVGTSVTSVLDVLTAVWICGTVAMLIYCAVSYLMLRHKVAPSVRLRNRLWISDGIASPFILGFVRPQIYIPSSVTDSQMAAVEAHERMHLCHGDHLWKLLGFIVLAVYWWNPLVWVAYVLFCRDIEFICDEAVVRKMEPSERKLYSEALLSFSMPRRLVSACPLAFGEVGVKGRIRSVLSYKKPGFWIIVAAALACIVVAVCFLTDPVNVDDDPFYYDRIQMEVAASDSDETASVLSKKLKAGDEYTLPGYGDVSEIKVTVESVKQEGKIVRLKLSRPLCRSDVHGSETDTVSLMMDRTLFEGMGYDSTTLRSPDGTKEYTFSHTLRDGAKKPETEDEKEAEPLTLPDPSVFEGEDVFAKLYHTTYSYSTLSNENDMAAKALYEGLKTDKYEPIQVDEKPTDVYATVIFSDGTNLIADFIVYEDATVCYGSRIDGTGVYYKAPKNTYKRIFELSRELAKVSTPEGMTIYFSEDYFYTDAQLSYSDSYGCYTLSYYSDNHFSGIASIYRRSSAIIYTDLKDYTLTLEETGEKKVQLCAEFDGAKHYYDIKEDGGQIVFESEEGRNDFFTQSGDNTSGFIDDNEYTDIVKVSMFPVRGRYSFSIELTHDLSDKYTVAYMPESVYKLSLDKDDDLNIRLRIEKGDEVTYADICLEDGKVVLKGAPEDFGEAYPLEEIDYKPTDYYDIAFAPVIYASPMSTVYIYDGPLSGRYSITVTVMCDGIVYRSTYAYDEHYDFDLVTEKSKLYLDAVNRDGESTRYMVAEDNGFGIKLELIDGEDFLEELDPKDVTSVVTEDNAFLPPFKSVISDIDGDGENETVGIGPGAYSGLGSFSLIITDGEYSRFGPATYVSDSISQTLVKDENGGVMIRAEYEDDVVFYRITSSSSGYVIADENGNGIR